ncbi:MAG: putative nicotinate-nucleotide pyrophosphorylase [carboxylating] [Acidimicrobiales bacterium]|nr:MAG: carboxylating nicotinate-nucleotide diphosphorylase [Actinomycetota bacterium]MBV6508466.1 putative nicotinate-nucleotide pyrophosphorylase [carboxylating] [Acidimicrobiales bacterium]RIK04730.1 MAG: carboxylating nicotinate-nucleotide diphosphorylase [Acidobacteriota bacterium]
MSEGAWLHPPLRDVRAAVERALAEDLTPLGDLTSDLLPAGAAGTAAFVARAAGCLAGTRCAEETYRQLDGDVSVSWIKAEGDDLSAGDVIGEVNGSLAAILTGERTALNFLCHLSGVATMTRQFVEAASGGARIWDTRKTTPGLRSLEKAAVRAGGGRNHRGNLSDWILLKDNHIAGMGIAGSIARAKDLWPARVVHVECDRLEQMVEAVRAGADAVLLDNMAPEQIRACVAEADRLAGDGWRRPLIEASGGVTLDRVGELAATGVDMISAGVITHSAPVLDIGLDVD